MLKRVIIILLWLTFVAYAFTLAPPDRPDTFELITRLINFDLDGINPLVVALFNIMGVLPLVYACITFTDGRGQKLPAWLFTGAALGVGAFALLPYLALRRDNPQFSGQKNWWLAIWESRITAAVLLTGAIALVYYGFSQGSWADFWQQWQTSRFIHVMSLDFVVLCLALPILLPDDLARRGMTDPRIFWAVAVVPLFGPLVYLLLRSPLIEEKATG
jgi:hypothetical protein